MVEILKIWVMNIVVVIFFLLISDILLPDGNVKQYIKVIIGLLVILIIIKPLLGIKSISSNFEDIYIETAAFLETDSYEMDVEALSTYQKEKAVSLYEDYIKKMILDAASRELKVEESSIDVRIDTDDKNTPGLAMVRQVEITVHENLDSSNIEKIKKVHILDSKKVINKDENEYNFSEKTYTEDLKNVITKLLPIDKDNIKVDFTVDNGGDMN